MKKILSLVMATCAISSTIGAVHELRTPISLLSKLNNINGSFSYPLKKVDTVLCNKTNVNFWSGAYYRSAFDGYCPKKCDSCCSLPESCLAADCSYNIAGDSCGCNCGSQAGCSSCCNNNGICLSNTNYVGCTSCPDNKVSLAQLIFGKATFTGSEAFSPLSAVPTIDAYLSTVNMTPHIDYKECGAVIGMQLERKFDDNKWRVAFNAALPIKSIEVTAHYNCDSVYVDSVVKSLNPTFGMAIIDVTYTTTGVHQYSADLGLPVQVVDTIAKPNAQFLSSLTGTTENLNLLNYPEIYFNSKGVRLCDTDQVVGLGDLETALVIGHDFDERSYVEVVGGIKFPTSKRNRCPGRVYFMPTGNNGHFETKIGVDGGWRSEKWVGLRADASYSHVLQACEKKAAQFKCATVRGIGPCIDAKVKYGYFLGHLDLTVFHPENQDMGAALGYEVYYKRQDCVCFCPCNGADRMEDFFGHVEPINPALLQKNSDILAHKIRGQVFNRWNYFELYAGASKVVGGFNGMAENEAYIGCDINF